MDCLDIEKRSNVMRIQSGKEIPHRTAVRLAGVFVSDGRGEEFDETLPGRLTSLDDERGAGNETRPMVTEESGLMMISLVMDLVYQNVLYDTLRTMGF